MLRVSKQAYGSSINTIAIVSLSGLQICREEDEAALVVAGKAYKNYLGTTPSKQSLPTPLINLYPPFP